MKKLTTRFLFLIAFVLLNAGVASAQKFSFQVTGGAFGKAAKHFDLEKYPTFKDVKDFGSSNGYGAQLTSSAVYSVGAEATIYILKGWGVNVGYSYADSRMGDAVSGDYKNLLTNPHVTMHVFNLGVAKKVLKLPMISIAPVVGLNIYANELNNVLDFTKDLTNIDPKNLTSADFISKENDLKYGLDFGVNVKLFTFSLGLKYDVFSDYVKLGLGIAI